MKNRIGYKLVFATVLFSAVITFIITGIQLYIDYKHEMKRVNNYESLISDSFLDSLTTSIWMYNNDQINIQLKGLINLPDMEFVEIKTEEGYTWTAGEKISKHILKKEFPLYRDHKGNKVLIGALNIVISLDEIYSGLFNTAITILAANGIKTFLVAGFILMIFQYLITRHLYSLLKWLKTLDIENSFEKFQMQRSKYKSAKQDELDEIVSAINEMQENLRKYLESEKRFKRLIENLQETHFLYRYDLPSNFTFLSSSITNVLGYSKDEILSQYSSYIVKNNLNRNNDLYFKQNLQDNKRFSFEIEMPHKEGGMRSLQVTETPVFDTKGRFVAIEGLAHDITDMKKIEAQLRHSQKMEAIGTLAGGIAHDFNNILGIIIGYTHVCMDEVINKPETYTQMNEILLAANRAKDLVKQILTFSRQDESEKHPVKITPIISEIIKFIRASLPATIEIRNDLYCVNEIIMADPVKIHQVLMNLCVNAWHAMKDKEGILTISLENTRLSETDINLYPGLKSGYYLKLSVHDTGHGIPKQNLERIFEPYFTTKDPEEGSGLGLAVVHAIIEEHGGYIWVYSDLNVGTTFNILLPAVQTNSGSDNQYENKITDVIPFGKNESILLVEDEQSLANIMKKILSTIGYMVVAETSPFEALERFSRNSDSFDLIITDKTMPRMTGLELAKKIKYIRKDIPIILTTGLNDSRNKNEISYDLFDKILTKPVSTDILAKTVRNILDKYQAPDKNQGHMQTWEI